MRRIIRTVLLCAAVMGVSRVGGQEITQPVRERIGESLTRTAQTMLRSGHITIDSVAVNRKRVELYASANCAYIPFRTDNVAAVYDSIRALLPGDLSKRQVVLFTDGQPIEELVPQPLRDRVDRKFKRFTTQYERPLVERVDVPYTPTEGLAGRHIAMWQSHGYYFEPKLNRWEWQRARIFETVEDLYTQSYVLPYLVPMLEHAGAYVMMPRERDTQIEEVVVDNDPVAVGRGDYTEKGAWTTGEGVGFAYSRTSYKDLENPFAEGTFRQTESVTHGTAPEVRWSPAITKEGDYAVYVSYKTLPQSVDDALYTVYHKGGTTQFRVNQTMGGGTWIYLGTFRFGAGESAAGSVVLSAASRKAGRTVTADGVKFGGGMGNIARIMPPEQRRGDMDYNYEVSGFPRYTEGARYWLQWAGFPDSVYTSTHQTNDYKDDYLCRGLWVNNLVGGSKNAPHREGLHIPIDLSLAFHTDAGTTPDDSIIGTLGIYYTHKTDGLYPNGTSRSLSRDLTDMVQSQIVADLKALYEPRWSRRGMWDDSYFEAHVPEVPAMLLELLSHQNFADMRYGLDPGFQFAVCRAIYKGILRFEAFQYKKEYVVQPLPVDHFQAQFEGENSVRLRWRPVTDSLEPTARPDRYVLYTRIDSGAFDNGRIVEAPDVRVAVEAGKLYSFRVAALNRGGESFPSETLAVCRVPNAKGTILIVNGFDRVDAPYSFVADSLAGFYDPIDHGVPYIKGINYIGSQYEFVRPTPYGDDDAAGFGASRADCETKVVAGNTFDYPSVHGRAMVQAGYSFVSCSNEALEEGLVRPADYTAVDLILGKQRETVVARGAHEGRYAAFSEAMQRTLRSYCEAGGRLMVSGAYVGSDLLRRDTTATSKAFANDILRLRLRTDRAALHGGVKAVSSPFRSITGRYIYNHTLNDSCYIVESPDAIEPADSAFTVFRYVENNLSAAVAYRGVWRVCALGFPIEAITDESSRAALVGGLLRFLTEQ